MNAAATAVALAGLLLASACGVGAPAPTATPEPTATQPPPPTATLVPPTPTAVPPTPTPTVTPIPATVVEDAPGDCYDMLTQAPAACQDPWGDIRQVSVAVEPPGLLNVTFTLAGNLNDFPAGKEMQIGFEFEGTRRTAVISIVPPNCEFTVKTVGTCSFSGNTITASLDVKKLPDCPDCDQISGVRFGSVYPWDLTARSITADNTPDTDYIPITLQ